MTVEFDGPWCEKWAAEVVEKIQQKEIGVFHPDDKAAFFPERTGEREFVFSGRNILQVDLLEWLPVMCQAVYEANPPKGEKWWASYTSNLFEALFPYYDEGRYGIPLGPSAYYGIIRINEDLSLHAEATWGHYTGGQYETPEFKEVNGVALFQGAFAHELVHVVRHMPYVVPAFLDWRAYWRVACHEGRVIDEALHHVNALNSVVDDYREKGEFQELCWLWPEEIVKPWWDALCAYSEARKQSKRSEKG
jgi:hypothetical protein